MPVSHSEKKYQAGLLITLAVIFIASGIAPYERTTWVMEIAPVVIGVFILLATYRRCPLTNLTYSLIWFFALILIVGGYYTYARMPLFDWIRDAFHQSRNHYDRFGHFFQGVTPALLTREVLLRTSPLKPGKWLFFLVTCVALAVSAGYELTEWAVAVNMPEQKESFVGSQGDVWDAQNDMFMCLCGAIIGQLFLSRWQDRLLKKLRLPQEING
jgi:putative membrane protein